MLKIAICGSMDFFAEMAVLAEELRRFGIDAYLPENEETKIDYSAASEEELANTKHRYIDKHLEKIRGSDGVLLANYTKRNIQGYVGANTLMEAAFAYALGKEILVLNDLGDQACRPEILGMMPSFLRGDLQNMPKR